MPCHMAGPTRPHSSRHAYLEHIPCPLLEEADFAANRWLHKTISLDVSYCKWPARPTPPAVLAFHTVSHATQHELLLGISAYVAELHKRACYLLN